MIILGLGESFNKIKQPDPTRPDPTRPNPTARLFETLLWSQSGAKYSENCDLIIIIYLIIKCNFIIPKIITRHIIFFLQCKNSAVFASKGSVTRIEKYSLFMFKK